jgi:hypothetical protein
MPDWFFVILNLAQCAGARIFLGAQSHDPLQNKKIAFTLPLVNYCAVYAQV